MRDTTRNCTNCKYSQENTYPCNECNLYDHDKWEVKITTNNPCEDLFKKAMASLDFANWVADEIFDDMWEYNKDAFAEIACRKLEKLGIVKEVDGEWIERKNIPKSVDIATANLRWKYECSKCGYMVGEKSTECPHCKARMTYHIQELEQLYLYKSRKK